MAKSKKVPFHKIRIHDNRWFLWAIAYLLIVALAMVGYLTVSTLNFDTNNTSITDLRLLHSYNDQRLGFGLRYPVDWSIEAGEFSISFLPNAIADEGVTVAQLPLTGEKILRKTLKIVNEEYATLGTEPATRIINDLGLGRQEVLIIAHHLSKLYVMRGSDGFVNKLSSTFHFLTK